MVTSKRYFLMLTANLAVLSMFILMYLVYSKTSILFEVYISMYMMLSISVMIDLISMTFMSTVFLISSLVMMYTVDYMKDDNENKFSVTMMLFISFMGILCMSGNLLWVMLGWDGLGITSFALIMYFQNWKSFNSAMVTFMCNRVGDLFILSSIIWFMSNGSMVSWTDNIPWFIQLMLISTALSKSAQIPFSSWLPLAMAAPTPVSSLVHSSTLVTAGVFLMIRFNSMMEESMLTILMLISSSTVMMAGLSATWEFDFKKIVALSTLSHIGLMMMFISIGDEWPAIIHLVTHSMFKSLLFMCAGSTIHSMKNVQDIRMINSLNLSNNSILVISVMSMMGLPFLSGFYSKEMMMMSITSSNLSMFFILSFMMAVMLTCIYSMRLLVFIMLGKCPAYWVSSKEGGLMMQPMIMGCITSSAAGGLIMWDTLMVSKFSTELPYNSILKEVLVVCMTIGMFVGFTFWAVPVGNYTQAMSSMMFINSFCYLTQEFMLKSSNTLMSLDIKGWTDYIISSNSYAAIGSFKGWASRLLNQPTWLNNLMLKVVITTLVVNLIIVKF